MIVPVSSLSPTIREALKSVQYGAPHIAVQAAETVSPLGAGGAGQRAFILLVDPSTGRVETKMGSWGGANMFNPHNQVDMDGASYPMPQNGIVIRGSIGHPRTFATVYVHPDTLRAFLPTEAGPELSEEEGRVLNAFRGLTSAGRKDEFQRWADNARRQAEGRWKLAEREYPMDGKTLAAHTETLIGKGLLARNKAGAISVTLAGKNVQTKKPGC